MAETYSSAESSVHWLAKDPCKEKSEMSRRDLLTDERRLFEELCSIEWLSAGFRNVKKNKGAPGVDGVTIAAFESRLDEELDRLKAELESWTYKPSPVRRVEIPKPGGKGIRLLGVPTVRDRVVHATLKLLLEPIFEPLFSDHSYGFRPERNQGQAVESARKIVAGGKPYVVDLDLSKFLDCCSYYPPADCGSAKRSGIVSGSFIFSPLRLPCETWMASSSPRLTRCNTVWRDTPRIRMASTMGT